MTSAGAILISGSFVSRLVAALFTACVMNCSSGMAQEPRTWEYLKHAGAQAEILHQYNTAQRFYAEAIEVARVKYGPASNEMEETSARLATVLVLRGQALTAEPFFRRAMNIAMSEKRSGKNPEDLVWLDDLADAYQLRWSGRYTELCLKNCAEIRDKISDGKHTKLAATLGMLSSFYSNTGRPDLALPLAERALKLNQAKMTNAVNRSQAANNLLELGRIFVYVKQYDKAEDSFAKAFEIYRKEYGPTHINLAPIYTLTGDIYKAAKQYAKAEGYFKMALGIYEKNDNPKLMADAKMLQRIAEVNVSLGKNSQAEKYYKQAIALIEKKQGSRSAEAIDPMTALSALYLKEHRKAEAKAITAKVEAIRAR